MQVHNGGRVLRPSYRRGGALAVRCPAGLAGVFARAWGQRCPSPLARRNITVALLAVADWRRWLDDAIALLSADEAARVQRRRMATDREALAIAYALHRLLLGRVLGCEPQDVPLHRDALGCPRLAGGIAHTSLSHADGAIALAVTISGPVGVDVEPRSRAAVMAEIARSVCHPSEAAGFSMLDEAARSAAMLALWVRKEALLKAAGIGLAVPMESFAAPEHHALRVPAVSAGAVQVRMLDAGAGCIAAVAGAPGAIVDCRWLRPVPAARVAVGDDLPLAPAAGPGRVTAGDHGQ